MSGLSDQQTADAYRQAPRTAVPMSELGHLVSMKVDGPAVLFIRVDPEKMKPGEDGDAYVGGICQALTHVLKPMKAFGIQFLVVPKDIDFACLGEAQLKEIGYVRLQKVDLERPVVPLPDGEL